MFLTNFLSDEDAMSLDPRESLSHATKKAVEMSEKAVKSAEEALVKAKLALKQSQDAHNAVQAVIEEKKENL